MTLHEAYLACEEGNFVSLKSFDDDQSMHKYNNSFYFEDGANLTDGNFDLARVDWAKDGWYIKHTKEKVDIKKLTQMHENNKDHMLQQGSYEDCIIK